MLEWPEITELRDVTIAPFAPGNSKSNMALEADPPSDLLGHRRYGRPQSVVKILPLSESEAARARVVEEPVIYGGPLFRHFGHALSESIHRLWLRFALKELHPASVAFAPIHNAKVMPYVIEALNLHGIARRQIIRIDEPIRFKRLFVGPQARQMAGPTIIPDYRTMLDQSLEIRLGAPGGDRRLYVSRMHHHHTGSFYGESFVESALAAEGFEIIYPEHYSLSEFVKMLRASSMAVFAEGSAIHALELCGSATPASFVIGRRPNSLRRFKPLLSNICERWAVSDRLVVNDGMADDPKKHSGVVDLAAVMDDLRAFAELEVAAPLDPAVALAAIDRDLDQHIQDPRNDRTADYDQRARKLRKRVRRSEPVWELRKPLSRWVRLQDRAATILSTMRSSGAQWRLSFSRNRSL